MCVLLVVCLISSPLISANYIYGDIYVDGNGNSRFDANTDTLINLSGLIFEDNKIKGQTSELTNKKGDVWTFSLDLKNYNDILLDIHLPKNLNSILEVQGIDNAINPKEKIVSLIDKNKKLDFLVEYTLKEANNYFLIYFLIFLISLFVVVFFIFKIFIKKNKLNSIFPLLNENEEKILKALINCPIRQKQLREQLGIPKSSFSRYIFNLEKKKLIFREGEGKNKILKAK